MIQYVEDNFKGQITEAVNKLLDSNNIHVCLLPPNTDRLQPVDISVNTPVKDFRKQQFDHSLKEKIPATLKH